MVIDQLKEDRKTAVRGKYRRLYLHLRNLPTGEWRASFRDIESIIGFELPDSAWVHHAWWANHSNTGRHSQAKAWNAAGWERVEVDLRGESVLFRRVNAVADAGQSLDEAWPVHSVGAWPEGLSLSRRDIYGERV